MYKYLYWNILQFSNVNSVAGQVINDYLIADDKNTIYHLSVLSICY